MNKPQDLEAAETVQTTNVPAVDLTRLVRPSWFKGDAACDWSEDAGHENGSYYCKCLECGADFVGHKRRHICRKCHYEAEAQYEALSPKERAAFDEKRNAEILAFFDRTNAKEHTTPNGKPRMNSINQSPPPKETNAAKLETSGGRVTRLVRGCVEITAEEIRREGVDVPFQSVLYYLAAKKGCPMAGITCPKLRDDYIYRISHYSEGRTTIEWEWNPTVNANTTNATAQTPPDSGTQNL